MDGPVHIAITRRVPAERAGEFEAALRDFVRRSMQAPGTCGVHMLFPPPGSSEYGVLRSFASEVHRAAFYDSPVYREWLEKIKPLVEGDPEIRQLSGLEAWFRDPHASPPPRWKMALLTWLAVWPVSMLVPAVLMPLLAGRLHSALVAGVVAAGIVFVLTWVAMPLLVKITRGWLHPSPTHHP